MVGAATTAAHSSDLRRSPLKGEAQHAKEADFRANGAIPSVLTKRQRRKQKRLNKASAVPKLEELSAYHTYHPGQQSPQEKMALAEGGKGSSSARRRSTGSADRGGGGGGGETPSLVVNGETGDSSDSFSDSDIPSRFRVSRVDKSGGEQRRQQQQQQQHNASSPKGGGGNGFLPNGSCGGFGFPIETGNMFGVLNNSVHSEDPTPHKDLPRPHSSSSPCNPTSSLAAPACPGAEHPSLSRRSSRGARRRLKLNPRSKSTSPQRRPSGESAKNKSMYRHFDPGKAEWMKQQQQQITR